MRIIGNAGEAREVQAVASGVLPSGVPVIVNADGTVSVVGETAVSQVIGSPTIFEAATTEYISSTFDSTNNKVVVFYKDDGNSNYGTAVVGTVSGTSISFGTPVVFHNDQTRFISSAFDSNEGKLVIVYRDDNNDGDPAAIVGTVSGTSISFGTPVFVSTDQAKAETMGCTFDSSQNKIVISWSAAYNSNYGTAIVGTVSGTSISFGTPTVFYSNTARYLSSTFDNSNNKTVVAFRGNTSGYGEAVVGTVSGTSISFGSSVVFSTQTSGGTADIATAFDSNSNKVVIGWQDGTDSNKGAAVVGTVSGTSISFGSKAFFADSATGSIAAVFDTNVKKIVFAYRDNSNSFYGTVTSGSVSGSSITFGSETVFETARANYNSICFDTNLSKAVIAFSDNGNSNQGTSLVFQAAGSVPNLTAENYIGMSEGVVSAVQTSGTEAVGTEVQLDAGNLSFTGSSSTFDSTNGKIVIIYSDIANSNYGTAIVGTVNGSSITFGTEVVFASVTTLDTSVCFDTVSGKVVIAYKNNSDAAKPGLAIVGTVSGNSISFGTAVEFDAARSDTPFAFYDSTNGKVVIAYESQNATAKAIVGTVSGTSISFGTASQFNASATKVISGAHDTSSGKAVLTYSDSGNSAQGTCVVATVSGTGISFGSEVVFETGGVARSATGTVYDAKNNKIVVSYSDDSDTDKAKAIVGTVSGTSITFGTAVTWQTGSTQHNTAVYHSDAGKVIVFAEDESDSGKIKYAVGTVSGTSINFTTAADFTSSGSTYIAPTYDISNRIAVAAYRKDSDSSGNAATLQVTYTTTTITRGQVADDGNAEINIKGAVAENQVGLTAGQS